MVYSFCPLLGSHQSYATFFSSLTTSVTIHMAIYCQYVLASGVCLALSPFGCHKPPVSSLLTCILVTHVHLSLMQTVTCLTIVSHFTPHLFTSSCLLSYLLINTLACCILFPVRISLLLSTNVYYTLSLYFFTLVYSLFFAHSLPLACSFSHALLLSHAHSLPTYHSMCPCDPFHTGHFILTNCFSLLLGGCTLTPYSGHTSFRSWSTPLYASSPFATQSLCGLS